MKNYIIRKYTDCRLFLDEWSIEDIENELLFETQLEEKSVRRFAATLVKGNITSKTRFNLNQFVHILERFI